MAVVGVCGTGKTTLVDRLRARGFNARQVSQEHSYVPDMWRRLAGPDLLVCLDASLEVVRRRLDSPNWPAWLVRNQIDRLRHARAHCDLYIHTDALTPDEVLGQVLDLLSERGIRAV